MALMDQSILLGLINILGPHRLIVDTPRIPTTLSTTPSPRGRLLSGSQGVPCRPNCGHVDSTTER